MRPRHLPAVPSRTRGSYWTWDPALLASPPRVAPLQVGDGLCSWAAAVTMVAVRTTVGAAARLPGALLGLVKLPHLAPPCPSCGVVTGNLTFCVHTQGQCVSPARRPTDDGDVATQSGAHRDGRIASTGSQEAHLKGPFGDTVCDQAVAARTEAGHCWRGADLVSVLVGAGSALLLPWACVSAEEAPVGGPQSFVVGSEPVCPSAQRERHPRGCQLCKHQTGRSGTDAGALMGGQEWPYAAAGLQVGTQVLPGPLTCPFEGGTKPGR